MMIPYWEYKIFSSNLKNKIYLKSFCSFAAETTRDAKEKTDNSNNKDQSGVGYVWDSTILVLGGRSDKDGV